MKKAQQIINLILQAPAVIVDNQVLFTDKTEDKYILLFKTSENFSWRGQFWAGLQITIDKYCFQTAQITEEGNILVPAPDDDDPYQITILGRYKLWECGSEITLKPNIIADFSYDAVG